MRGGCERIDVVNVGLRNRPRTSHKARLVCHKNAALAAMIVSEIFCGTPADW